MFGKRSREVKRHVHDNVKSSRHNQKSQLPEYNGKITTSSSVPSDKSSYNLPTVGVQSGMLSSELVGRKAAEGMYFELTKNYHIALFKASIKALDCPVVEILPTPFKINIGNNQQICHTSHHFVRDPVVIIHDEKLIISCRGNEEFNSKGIINKVREMVDYEHKLIEDAYFEGGNVWYIPSKKMLLHGLNPRSPQADPTHTNRQLEKVLCPYGIHVSGLRLHSKVLHSNQAYREFYYHLDCFMQLLPDGRLIILNKAILSQFSQKKLKNLLGDNFIDLAYPDYLTNPVLFNFIAIPNVDGFTLISPSLPAQVADSLAKLNLSLITPASLDVRSIEYNKEHTKKVVAILKSEGYTGVNASNLATHLATNIHGYRLTNGEILSFSQVNSRKRSTEKSMDVYYHEEEVTFAYHDGGPHCLTLEIVPSKPIGHTLAQTKRAKKNDGSFFSAPPNGDMEKPDKALLLTSGYR